MVERLLRWLTLSAGSSVVAGVGGLVAALTPLAAMILVILEKKEEETEGEAEAAEAEADADADGGAGAAVKEAAAAEAVDIVGATVAPSRLRRWPSPPRPLLFDSAPPFPPSFTAALLLLG